MIIDLAGDSRRCACNGRTNQCHPETGDCLVMNIIGYFRILCFVGIRLPLHDNVVDIHITQYLYFRIAKKIRLDQVAISVRQVFMAIRQMELHAGPANAQAQKKIMLVRSDTPSNFMNFCPLVFVYN